MIISDIIYKTIYCGSITCVFAKKCPINMQADHVPFQKIIDFDNNCFISVNNLMRRQFLKRWMAMKGAVTYVALDKTNVVIGYAIRVPENSLLSDYDVGPWYACDALVAESLLCRHLNDVIGSNVNLLVP